MSRKVWLAIALSVLLAAAALFVLRARPPNIAELRPEDVTKIELRLIQWDKDGKRNDVEAVVVDPGEIKRFLDTIALEKKQACKCGHMEEVTFHTRRGVIGVSICDHCFDVYQGRSGTYYKMPPAFYALFKKRIQAAQEARSPAPQQRVGP